jgi:N6-L-threonylcarbamoyladenine synthase
VLRLVEKLKASGTDPLPMADLCASFQATVARSLTKRAVACARDFDLDTIAVGGGVAANSGLASTPDSSRPGVWHQGVVSAPEALH